MKSIDPNDFGTRLTVDQCRKLDMCDLLSLYRTERKKMQLSADVMGVPIGLNSTKTNFNGIRYWFSCPRCAKRVRIIYRHPLSGLVGCRECLNLDYRKRKYKGMLEEGV